MQFASAIIDQQREAKALEKYNIEKKKLEDSGWMNDPVVRRLFKY